MYQAAFDASQASPKKDKKETNGTANKDKKANEKKVAAPKKTASIKYQSSCQGECKSRGLKKPVGNCT